MTEMIAICDLVCWGFQLYGPPENLIAIDLSYGRLMVGLEMVRGR